MPTEENADGFEFMTLTSDNVSTRLKPLFDRKLVGTRHAEDGDPSLPRERKEKRA